MEKQIKGFVVNEDNWPEAKEEGWVNSIRWAPEEYTKFVTKETKKFVKEELPKKLSKLYDEILKAIEQTMPNQPDAAVEIVEEYVGTNLSTILIELAGAVDKKLIKSY